MAPQLGAENLNKLDRTFTWSHLTQTDVETGTLVYQTVLFQGIVKGLMTVQKTYHDTDTVK